VRFVGLKLEAVRFVKEPFVATMAFAPMDPAYTEVPVAFVKLSVVTVEDPAERLPVRARLVPVPPVKERFVMVPFVRFALVPTMFVPIKVPAKREVPVAFVKLSVVTVEDPAERLPVRARVEPVALVYEREVMVPFVKLPFVTKMFDPVAPLKERYVPKRFVEVVFVPVALVQVRFVGLKLEAVRFVKEPFVATMAFAPMDPAYTEVPVVFVKLSVVTVEDPAERLPVRARLVPVPPVKERFVMVPFVRFALVPTMFVPIKVPAKREVPVAFVKLSVVTVLDPAERLPVRARVEPVAFVKLSVWREESAVTESVPVTLKLFVIANAPVEVPPAN
jgi:hypothetical protein